MSGSENESTPLTRLDWLSDILHTQTLCLAKQKELVSINSIAEGAHVALFCSAKWCPPCQKFTPALKSTYEALNKDGKRLEVVYVSLDRSLEDFEEKMAGMPWHAVPWDSDRNGKICSTLGVMGIPTLIIYSPDGKVVTRSGVQAVYGDPEGSQFPWANVQGAPTGLLSRVMIMLACALLMLRSMQPDLWQQIVAWFQRLFAQLTGQ